jgi:hypothetical protein
MNCPCPCPCLQMYEACTRVATYVPYRATIPRLSPLVRFTLGCAIIKSRLARCFNGLQVSIKQIFHSSPSNCLSITVLATLPNPIAADSSLWRAVDTCEIWSPAENFQMSLIADEVYLYTLGYERIRRLTWLCSLAR